MTEYARARAKNHKPPSPPPARVSQAQRTPLKRVSKKRAALMAKVGPERRARKESTQMCMCCREPLPAYLLEIHEVASGPAREKCLEWIDLQLVLCRGCHEHVQRWPAAKQIALGMMWDIEKRCALYCDLKGYAPTAVVADEVITFLMFKKPPRKRGKG